MHRINFLYAPKHHGIEPTAVFDGNSHCYATGSYHSGNSECQDYHQHDIAIIEKCSLGHILHIWADAWHSREEEPVEYVNL